MTASGLSARKRILNEIEKALSGRCAGALVTRKEQDIPKNPLQSEGPFPYVYIMTGHETRDGSETSGNHIVTLEITIELAVNSDEPENDIEDLIQSVDNAMLKDMTLNQSAIAAYFESTEQIYSSDMIAITNMQYKVTTEYTQGDR